MPHIRLSEEVYARAKKQADLAGFSSVDDYIAHEVDRESEWCEAIDAKFTPEVVAHLDRIVAEMNAGGPSYTFEQVEQMLADARLKRKAS